MNSSLTRLIEHAKKVRMTEPEKTEQRISFAFGTAKIENDNITKEMVIAAVRQKKARD